MGWIARLALGLPKMVMAMERMSLALLPHLPV